ncbi:MAG: LamG-like jellyroll fold domain-containing protein [Flavobacteriales bacterium]
MQFPGTTSHVAIPFSADLDVEATDAFTISLWYQGGSEEMGDLEWLFAKRAAGSSWNTTDYALSLYDLNRVLASGSNGELWSPVMPPIPDPTWHHLAYRYNNGIHHIWLDNVLVGSDSTQQVTVGQSAQGITIGEQFEGAMDDIRYYGRALSAEEVELLYQEDAACTIGTGLSEAAAPVLSATPNPATDLLTVQLPTAGGTLELFDATGRSVHRLAVTDRTAVLSLGHLPKGMYLLQYGSGAGAVVQRIAKR